MVDLTPKMTDAEFSEACTVEIAGWLYFVKRACADALQRVQAGRIGKREYLAELREARNAPLLTTETTKERIRRFLGAMRSKSRPMLP